MLANAVLEWTLVFSYNIRFQTCLNIRFLSIKVDSENDRILMLRNEIFFNVFLLMKSLERLFSLVNNFKKNKDFICYT